MSTAKRARRQQAGAKAASPTQPASKRIKTTKDSHVPARNGLDFLVDEDRRQGKKLEAKLTNGVPSSKATRVDDSQAVVAPNQSDLSKVRGTQDVPVEITSGEESSSEEESEDGDGEDDVNGAAQHGNGNVLANGHMGGMAEDDDSEEDAVAGAERMDIAQQDADVQQDPDEDLAEPSFGDLLQARHPEQIDVRASFPDPTADRQALVQTTGLGALVPSGTSLVTVLTQALKTNDRDQLELCFQQGDVPTIRTTVQRLQSQHVATLLQRVAERIHKRPGRIGSLLVWIQWSLVAHGAYLATQPDVMARLRALSRVLKERAGGLQPLLHLKGKLDMLSAQLDMRRSMQAASRARADAEDEDDDEAVLYVEGQEDDDWSDEDQPFSTAAQIGSSSHRSVEPAAKRQQLQNPTPNTDHAASSDSESDDAMPNGVMQEADDDSSDVEEDDQGMLDVEAEETSDDEGEGASSEEDESEPESESDVDDDDDESDISEGVKPPDPAILNRKR